jgi:hypothetical protein
MTPCGLLLMPSSNTKGAMVCPYPHSNKTVTTIKAIETAAYGCRFRSKLEARFAVFLTELGVTWQYEHQGFRMPSGPYAPDFFLPLLDGGTWIELKPYGPGSYFGYCDCEVLGIPKVHDNRLDEFANYVQSKSQQFYVAYGIPSDRLMDGFAEYNAEGMLESLWDPFMWSICACGKTVGIEFDGRGDRIRCLDANCCKSPHGDKGYSHDHSRIRAAVAAARAARFEHGETP